MAMRTVGNSISKPASMTCRAHLDSGCNEAIKRRPLLRRYFEAELAAPPEYIVHILRPFIFYQVTHFGSRQIAGKALAEIVHGPGVLEDLLHAAAIGMHQSFGVAFRQKRPSAPRLGNFHIKILGSKFSTGK